MLSRMTFGVFIAVSVLVAIFWTVVGIRRWSLDNALPDDVIEAEEELYRSIK
jgi:hypothetical protein